MIRRSLVALILLVGLGSLRLAAADDGTERAASLFEDGKKLAASGNVTEACKKFEESEALDKRPGTLFNVAVCRDRAGQRASAWAAYTDAVSMAAASHDAWAPGAEKRANELKASLGFVTIDVAERIDGLAVTLDHAKVDPSAFGGKTPVEPGPHVLDATAPGKKAWHSELSVEAGGESRASVPKLEIDPAVPQVGPSPALVTAPSDAPSPGWQRPVGIASLAVGGAGLVVGGIFGALALGTHSDLTSKCGSVSSCTIPASDGMARDNASALGSTGKTQGTVSTIGFVAGGVFVAAGAILLFTAPDSTSRVGLGGAPGRASLTFDTRF